MGHVADAYRAELLGIYGTLSVIHYIESKNPAYRRGILQVGCDNDKAGWMSGQHSSCVSPSARHMDLLKSIRYIQQQLRTSVTFYHIYGHQDEKVAFSSLTREVQLNCIVDKMAQDFIDNAHSDNTAVPNPIFYHEGLYVTIGGVKVAHKLPYMLREWVGKRRLRQYLYDHGHSWSCVDKIDFHPLERYLAYQSQWFKVWFSKHWSNFVELVVK